MNMSNKPGHLARRFQQIAVAVFQSEMAALGCDLTPVQFAALTAIEDQPGIDQVTLAGLIAYDRTTITGVVDRLAGKGWVERQISAKDRRARTLIITDAGRSVLRQVSQGVERAQVAMLSGLTPQECQTFMNLLRKAVESANELSRAPMRAA